jgi:hypothetical protein
MAEQSIDLLSIVGSNSSLLKFVDDLDETNLILLLDHCNATNNTSSIDLIFGSRVLQKAFEFGVMILNIDFPDHLINNPTILQGLYMFGINGLLYDMYCELKVKEFYPIVRQCYNRQHVWKNVSTKHKQWFAKLIPALEEHRFTFKDIEMIVNAVDE